MPPSASALLQIYEDRIVRLEEGVGDCKVDLGVIKSQLSDGVAMLSEKLDVVAQLSERVTALETREQIATEVRTREEHARAKRHDRRSRFFKIGAAVGSGIVAVIGLVLKIWFGG